MRRPEFPVFDGHNDTLLDLHVPKRDGGRSFFVEGDTGHIDLPRAERGGFAGGFFAIFVPPLVVDPSDDAVPTGAPSANTALDPAYARSFTEDVIARLFLLEKEAAGRFKVVRTADELDRCLADGIMAAILHFEGAEAIHPDLGALEEFYEIGLRSLGIVWSRPNIYGEGVPFIFPGTPDVGAGLTGRGLELVRECNRLGVLVGLSHLNERGFWDVAEHSTAPLVATHAAVHALSRSSRNLTDEQLRAVGETDGVVGVNFHVGFLRDDGQRNPDTPLEVLVRHIDYMVDLIGIEHVAFGSDFDGAIIPGRLGDVAGLPLLIEELRRAGYDDAALHRLTHENWQRVVRVTWK